MRKMYVTISLAINYLWFGLTIKIFLYPLITRIGKLIANSIENAYRIFEYSLAFIWNIPFSLNQNLRSVLTRTALQPSLHDDQVFTLAWQPSQPQ